MWWIDSNLCCKYSYVWRQSFNFSCSRWQSLFQRMQHVHKVKHSHQPPHFAHLLLPSLFCPDHLQNIKKDSSSLWPQHQHLTNTSSQLSGFFMTHWKYEALEPFLWGWWSGLSVLLWWTRLQEAQTKYIGPELWNLEAFNDLITLDFL